MCSLHQGSYNIGIGIEFISDNFNKYWLSDMAEGLKLKIINKYTYNDGISCYIKTFIDDM